EARRRFSPPPWPPAPGGLSPRLSQSLDRSGVNRSRPGRARRGLAPPAALGAGRAGEGAMIRRGVLLAGLLVLLGCTSPQQVRSQAEDELSDRDADVKTVGEVTSVGHADAIPVIGVG